MNLVDAHGLDTDLKFYIRMLLDWVQQDDIVDAVVSEGYATRPDLADLYLVLFAMVKRDLGVGETPEFWQDFEAKVKQSFLAFIQSRKVRRLIAKHCETRGQSMKETLKALTEMKESMA